MVRLTAELRKVAVKHENESAHVSNLGSNRRTRLLIVLLFGVGVLLFTLMTAFPNAASVFAFSGLALMAISGVLAISNWARTREKGEKGVGLVAMVVAAVLGYLAASYLIPVGEPTSSQISSPNLSVTQNAVSSSGEPSMAQVGQDSVGSGLYSSESTVLRIASDLIPVEGSRAQNIVSEVKAIGYKTKSKAPLNWEKVQVDEYKGQLLVSVPFEGRPDLEIVNRVVFFVGSGEVQISEVYMTILNEDTFKIRHWMNSKLMVNKVGTVPSTTSSDNTAGEAGVQNVGMNWKTLDKCLTTQGVGSWAVAGISLVCGGACVLSAGLGCPLCIGMATGLGGAFVEKCVRQAWT